MSESQQAKRERETTRLVRRLRQRIFDYEDVGLGDKAQRVLAKALHRQFVAIRANELPSQREARELRAVLRANPHLTALDLM